MTDPQPGKQLSGRPDRNPAQFSSWQRVIESLIRVAGRHQDHGTYFEQGKANSYFAPKFLSPEGQHLTSAGYDRALEVARQRRDAIARAWHEGAGHHGDDSAWEAYNGAVQVIDHDGSLYKTRGSRVAALLGGSLRDRKQLVLNALVEHAKATRG